MKIKLGDLTLSQFHEICGKTGCDNCPLSDSSAQFPYCMADFRDRMDREVEVDFEK